ncbi:hypothetical protein AYO40_03535 [Planctomycetaceae bacterium SCGC AG-212-D15]|nr:hypothetical protein AYO40_03535 [Planctomycetaceae bacterium SCGC AG-212-D15]
MNAVLLSMLKSECPTEIITDWLEENGYTFELEALAAGMLKCKNCRDGGIFHYQLYSNRYAKASAAYNPDGSVYYWSGIAVDPSAPKLEVLRAVEDIKKRLAGPHVVKCGKCYGRGFVLP